MLVRIVFTLTLMRYNLRQYCPVAIIYIIIWLLLFRSLYVQYSSDTTDNSVHWMCFIVQDKSVICGCVWIRFLDLIIFLVSNYVIFVWNHLWFMKENYVKYFVCKCLLLFLFHIFISMFAYLSGIRSAEFGTTMICGSCSKFTCQFLHKN